MPIIFVYGIPSAAGQEYLLTLCTRLRERAASIPELCLHEEQVSVFFPTDLLQTGLGEEVIIFVRGLFEKPERTQEVCDRLAQALIDCAGSCIFGLPDLGNPNLIECFVESFNPTSGFASKSIAATEPSRE